MKISIVIPTLNEEENIRECIAAARRALSCEIIVVDAGSKDNTVSVVSNFGIEVVRSGIRQRARQLNEGSAVTAGDILLFLHADTFLPRSAGDSIERAMASQTTVGGGFARKFKSSSPFLRFTCLLAELRCRAFGWFLGDQAIFVRKSVFQKLGGFRELDQFEDLDFARRMKSVGRVVTLRPPVVSSSRRFYTKGPWRRTWRDFFLTIQYLKGDPAATTRGPAPSL